MTTNSTEFFREKSEYWEPLKSMLPTDKKLRCWVAACSSGEDAYTLSIWLQENYPLQQFEIMATDISMDHLRKAEKGCYSKRELETCPEAYRVKYFNKSEEGYMVDPILKQSVTFKKHNLLADPFNEGFDLILCKNVSFYFSKHEASNLFKKNTQFAK